MLIIVVLSVCLGDAPFFRNQGRKIRIFQNLPFFGTFTENDVAPANLYRFWWNFVCSFGYGWVYPPANFIKKSWSVLEIQRHMWTCWVFDTVTFFTYTALSPAKVERSKRFFMWNCVYIYPTSVPSFSKKKYQQGSVLGINTKHQARIMTSIGGGFCEYLSNPRVYSTYTWWQSCSASKEESNELIHSSLTWRVPEIVRKIARFLSCLNRKNFERGHLVVSDQNERINPGEFIGFRLWWIHFCYWFLDF